MKDSITRFYLYKPTKKDLKNFKEFYDRVDGVAYKKVKFAKHYLDLELIDSTKQTKEEFNKRQKDFDKFDSSYEKMIKKLSCALFRIQNFNIKSRKPERHINRYYKGKYEQDFIDSKYATVRIDDKLMEYCNEYFLSEEYLFDSFLDTMK